MNLSIHDIKSIKIVLKQFKHKDGKPFFCRDIKITNGKENHLISLYSNKKANLKIE